MNTENLYLKELTPFSDSDGRLKALPAKNKKKLIAVWYLAEKFDEEIVYTEHDVNNLLDNWTIFHDPATLRRELVNKELLERTPDCTVYKKKKNIPSLEDFVLSNV